MQFREREHVLVLSEEILEEVGRVLRYPRLRRAMRLTDPEIDTFLETLRTSAELVELDETLTVPIADPKDVMVVRTAISGKVSVIVTLDRDFHTAEVLAFCGERGIRVMTDVEALREYFDYGEVS